MTNKEAITILTHNWMCRELLDNSYQYEALNLAIKALEAVDNSDKLNPTVYVVPQECIKVLADTVADVIQKIDWNSLIKIVADKEAENN